MVGLPYGQIPTATFGSGAWPPSAVAESSGRRNGGRDLIWPDLYGLLWRRHVAPL
jgi:hypothetical protein